MTIVGKSLIGSKKDQIATAHALGPRNWRRCNTARITLRQKVR